LFDVFGINGNNVVGWLVVTCYGTNLTSSASYYNLTGGPSGWGTQYFVGDTVTSSVILYAYDENGFCFSEEPLYIQRKLKTSFYTVKIEKEFLELLLIMLQILLQ